ncbi:MAG: hypothetical protein NXI27_16445 [Alphaproteobacteria bacterium]|nr:hypothetical protein [Alphaproteobacteria bacterium]
MKGLEEALRKALSGPGGSNPQQRQRVYASARRALVNGLAKQGQEGSEKAKSQRRGLEQLIHAIESEYQAPAPVMGGEIRAAAPRRAPPSDNNSRMRAEPRAAPQRGEPRMRAEPQMREPQFDEPRRREPDLSTRRGSPSLDAIVPDPPQRDPGGRQRMRGRPKPPARHADRLETAPISDHLGADFGAGERGNLRQPGPPPVKKKRRFPIFSLILVSALAVAFLGIGIVWVVVGGVLETPAQRDTSVPNPPAKIDSEDFAGLPSPDGAFSGDWIEVFAPRDIARVTGRGAAQVDLVETDNREALRIVSRSAEADGEALFEVGPGILQSLGGGQAMVAMTLRSATETPTQIYIRCELPGDGDCGRRRFDVTYEAGDIIFSLDLSGSIGSRPAFLAINSDVAGAGNGVDVYGIRIRRQ